MMEGLIAIGFESRTVIFDTTNPGHRALHIALAITQRTSQIGQAPLPAPQRIKIKLNALKN